MNKRPYALNTNCDDLKKKSWNHYRLPNDDHGPVLVFGFKPDILFIDDKNFEICITQDNGSPIYTSIIIKETDFEKIIDARNKYISENHKGISDLEKWAKEKGEQYNRTYECKWQLAIWGKGSYTGFMIEEDMLTENRGRLYSSLLPN